MQLPSPLLASTLPYLPHSTIHTLETDVLKKSVQSSHFSAQYTAQAAQLRIRTNVTASASHNTLYVPNPHTNLYFHLVFTDLFTHSVAAIFDLFAVLQAK